MPRIHPPKGRWFCGTVFIKDGGNFVKDWYFGHHHKDREVEIDGIMYHGMYQKIEEAL